jgi:protein-disulfide isomerase
VLQRHLDSERDFQVRLAITRVLGGESNRPSEPTRQAEEEQRRAEAARQAEEERRRTEAARRAEEEHQRSEAPRQAEEERQRAEAARKIDKERQQAEAARRAEEERRRAETARLAEEGEVDRAQPGAIPSGDELTRVRGIVSHRRLSRRWLAMAASVLIAITIVGGGYWLYTGEQQAAAPQKVAEDQQQAAAPQKVAEDQQRAAALKAMMDSLDRMRAMQELTAAAQKGTPDAPAVLQITKNDRILGNPDARITIVEYASLTCPHCANFAKDVLPEIKKEWIDTGIAKLVFRDFPLDEAALRAAMVARCAPPERYYAFVDTFFAAQDKWVRGSDYRGALARLAKLGGLDQGEFEACIKNTELENKIVEGRLKAAQELNVSSTPAFFVNGSKFSAAPTVQEFGKLLHNLLMTLSVRNSRA